LPLELQSCCDSQINLLSKRAERSLPIAILPDTQRFSRLFDKSMDDFGKNVQNEQFWPQAMPGAETSQPILRNISGFRKFPVD
jgi:hypothetical protein